MSVWVMGIGQTHNASACLFRDGVLVGAVSEERFNRDKNTSAFPSASIRWLLEDAGIEARDLAAVIHSYRHPVPGYALASEVGRERMRVVGEVLRYLGSRSVNWVPQLNRALRYLFSLYWSRENGGYQVRFREHVSSELGVCRERVLLGDHHESHAFAGYSFFCAEGRGSQDALVLTLDAEGDDACASVRVIRRGVQEVLSITPGGHSIGVLYGVVTEWLGMRMNEHEYKVMGLAPYSDKEGSQRVADKLGSLIRVDGLRFLASPPSGAFAIRLRSLLRGERFDHVAGGVQLLLERLVLQWAANAIAVSGVRNLVLSGGVFMNVKLNLVLREALDIDSIVVCPSAGDESSPIGAAYAWICENRHWSEHDLPISNLYLGPSFSDTEVSRAVEAVAPARYSVEELSPEAMEEQVVELLASHEIVARFNGKMEFGARALGNRSILAHPACVDLVRQINEQIKGRDFWMPFACSVLEEYAPRYLVDGDFMSGRYMAMAFRTHEDSYPEIAAGSHPFDHTVRPQILRKVDNSAFHSLVSRFCDKTGIGAILNTSFNLHGEPVVCSPDDALRVFELSGLRTLALGNWLIRKA